jgi:hypothetical protein
MATFKVKLDNYLSANAALVVDNLAYNSLWEPSDESYDEDGELLDNWLEIEVAYLDGETDFIAQHMVLRHPHDVLNWLDIHAPRALKREAYKAFDQVPDGDTYYKDRVQDVFIPIGRYFGQNCDWDVERAAWALKHVGYDVEEAA